MQIILQGTGPQGENFPVVSRHRKALTNQILSKFSFDFFPETIVESWKNMSIKTILPREESHQ